MLLDDLFEFAQMGLQYLRTARSPLPYADVALDMELILEDIPLHEDIAAFLQQWRGLGLDVTGCVAFEDHTMEALGAEHDANSSHTSHERRNFRIADCPNVSTSALKELITSRNNNMYGQVDRCTVRVSGEGGILSPGDKE